MHDQHKHRTPHTDPANGVADKVAAAAGEGTATAIPAAAHSPTAAAPQTTVQPPPEPASRTDAAADAAAPLRPRTLRLLAAALAISLLFDRLVAADPYLAHWNLTLGAFWISCAAIVTALHWRTAGSRPAIWFVDAAIMALAAWLALHDGPSGSDAAYALLTVFVAAPSLLMLHAQLANGLFNVRRPWGIALRWLSGWIIQPLTGLGGFGRAVAALAHSAASGEQRPLARKIGIALAISVPVLAVLVPLLASADMVFRYGLLHLIGDIDATELLAHGALVLIPFPLLFSLLAGLDDTDGDAASAYAAHPRIALDPTVTAIVLGMVLAVYAVFCSVQFTFLFAGAGLPDGLTYAEYARGGFFQLLAVASINIAVFGAVLSHAARTRAVTVSLAGLIAATGVMLASAARRLALYIGAYGLTWLRFASMTFIGLLAVVLALCLIRMATDRLPLAAVCFALFVVWYVALGYCAAPAIAGFNAMHGFGAPMDPLP